MKTNLNELSHIPPLVSAPFLILSIQLGTIRILKMGPQPCWILRGNGWLAVYQEAFQSGIILMNFSRSKVWPEDVQVEKFNLVSVPGSAWVGEADFCELNSENTKTSHQNVNQYLYQQGDVQLSERSNTRTLLPSTFFPWKKSTQKSIIIGNLLSESGIKGSLVRCLESLMASHGWDLMKPSPLEHSYQLFRAPSGLSSEFYAHQLPFWLTYYFFRHIQTISGVTVTSILCLLITWLTLCL